MANTESWFQRWSTKKRFWGSVAMTVGGLAQLVPIPLVSAIGLFLVKGGSVLTTAGLIDKADRVKKEKRAAESGDDSEDSSESK